MDFRFLGRLLHLGESLDSLIPTVLRSFKLSAVAQSHFMFANIERWTSTFQVHWLGCDFRDLHTFFRHNSPFPSFHRYAIAESPLDSVCPSFFVLLFISSHTFVFSLHSFSTIQWSCTRFSNSISLLARAPIVSYDDPLWSLSFRSSCCFLFLHVRGIPPPIASTSSHADVFIFITLQP